jgi:hypothetical protein
MGIEVFWPCKYLLMNDEEVAMAKDQCQVIVDGVNNLLKMQVSCKDNSLMENFQAKNIRDAENVGDIVENLHNEGLCDEMIYIFKDGVERFVAKSRFDSMNDERSEENITEGDEEVGSEENFEQLLTLLKKAAGDCCSLIETSGNCS